jgi:hypothetical protein
MSHQARTPVGVDDCRQIPTIDFPSEYLKIGSSTREAGTIHLSHTPIWALVGMDWRRKTWFAALATMPQASR